MSQDAPCPAASHRVSVRICGAGAVSPAGWGCAPLLAALRQSGPISAQALARPGWEESLLVRAVPPHPGRPEFLRHPRLRRASAISQHTVAAALEALGPHLEDVRGGALRLGVVLCTMSGSVTYSRRFYSETLQDPATASPLVFPETVFNAPASHLAALLETTAVDYTLVGDTSTYFQGLAMAAHWLVTGKVRGCLVVGAEEMDWPTADAFRLFSRDIVLSAGAGALFLQDGPGAASDLAMLDFIPTPRAYHDVRGRNRAAAAVQAELADGLSREGLLCDGLQGVARFDRAELRAWKSWPGRRLSPKRILGEGLTAATAWQCIAAVHALSEHRHGQAAVTNAGCNQHAGGVRFAGIPPDGSDSPIPSP